MYYLRNDRWRDREPMPFNLFPFSFMVKLNIGPVREDHVVTANPDQIFLYLDMRYWDVFKWSDMNWRLETGNMLVSLVILSLPAQAMTDNNDKTISK